MLRLFLHFYAAYAAVVWWPRMCSDQHLVSVGVAKTCAKTIWSRRRYNSMIKQVVYGHLVPRNSHIDKQL